jgi:hypothetical protein
MAHPFFVTKQDGQELVGDVSFEHMACLFLVELHGEVDIARHEELA